MKYSVVIVVKNDPGVRNSLRVLQAITAKRDDCEVLVIDASTPGLRDIKKEFPWVRWTYFKNTTGKRLTIPEQRNLGTRKARGEVIIFLDANCLPAKSWLPTIAKAFTSKKCMAITGPITSVGQNKLHDKGYEVFADGQPVHECGAANLGGGRGVLEALGGFDENLSYGEDVDLSWRTQDAGQHIIFKKGMAIAHDWGEFREEFRRAVRYGMSRTALYKKHPSRVRRLFGPDINVLIYPTFLLLLPVTYWLPFYPLLILVPMARNLRNSPLRTTTLHLLYGWGAIKGIFAKV